MFYLTYQRTIAVDVFRQAHQTRLSVSFFPGVAKILCRQFSCSAVLAS